MKREFKAIARRTALALGDEPPTEFPIFRPDSEGRIETEYGTDIFDRAAAEEVMRRYRERGSNRLILDLEHRSLSPTDASSTDALAYFDLEMRGSDLWAVNVTYAPEGRRRLQAKSQVYLSPAFFRTEDGRVSDLINVGLTSQPATFSAVQLVAASKLGRKTSAMIQARVPLTVRARLSAEAHRIGFTPGQFVRGLVMLATRRDDPESTLKNLRVALQLAKDAPVEEIRAALDRLLEEIDASDPAPADPTAGASDPPSDDAVALGRMVMAATRARTPAEALTRFRKMMADVEISRRREAMHVVPDVDLRSHDARHTPRVRYASEFDKRSNACPPPRSVDGAFVRPLNREERAFCKREGITEAEFRLRLENAVRRRPS